MKKFRFVGLNAGNMDIAAETQNAAFAQASAIEWHHACSNGNCANISYVGQIQWEVVGSRHETRVFDEYDAAVDWYNEICPHDNCGLSPILTQ